MSQPGNVPDQRLQELQEQLRRQVEQTNELKRTIDVVMSQRAAPPQQPQRRESVFKPEVEQGIQEIIQANLQQQEQKFRGAYNSLWEKNDALEFQQLYGRDTLEKYNQKIEDLRRQKQQQGQFISRDEAYKYIAFEENNRKPKLAPEPVKTPPVPTFDPYLNQWVIPDQAAPQTPAPQTQTQAPTTQQTAPNQEQNPPPSTIGTPPVTEQNHVVTQQGVQSQADFFLPQEGSFKQAAPSAPDSGTSRGLDLERSLSDPKALESFANKYGDVPL